MRLSDIEEFHSDYMRVAGAPDNKPFIQPFLSRGKGVKLLNKNLQGSYAPSSIRSGQALSKVVKVVDHSKTIEVGGPQSGIEYTLVSDHANRVLSDMLAGNRILGASLAVFLFRDRKIALGENLDDSLIIALRDFFRIEDDDQDGEHIFNILFEDDSSNFSKSDFEKV